MTRLLLPIMIATLPVAASLAQAAAGDELRGRAVGEIRNGMGEPWVGAEVVLLSWPLPGDINIGEVDEVTAITDAQGRFMVPILRGRPYTAWAWGPPTPEGRPATPVFENVFVQRPVVLRENRVLPRHRLVLEELDRWSGCTFEVRVVDHTGNPRVTRLAVADGTATLPYLLGSHAFVEVFAKQGETLTPLARDRVAIRHEGDVRVVLPERQRVICWVREAGGQACAGAAVFRRLGGVLHPAGTTDAAGKLQLDVANVTVPSPEFSTLVMAEGCCFGICMRFRDGAGQKPEVPDGATPDDLFCYLDAGETVHARVLVDGRPLAGLPVWCSGMASNRPTRRSAAHDSWHQVLATDAQGRFAVGGLSGPYYRRASHIVLRECDYQRLPPNWRSGLYPVVFAPLVGQPGTGTADDPITVDLTSMCPIELRITEDSGTPAVDAAVSFTSLGTDSAAWPWSSEARADQVGRLRILVPGQQPLGFRAVRGMSLLIRGFETGPGRTGAGAAVAQFQLPPPTGIRGVLREPDGSPGKERTVHASFNTNNEPAAWSYESQQASVLDDVDHNRMRVLLPDDARQRLMLTGLIGQPVTTDEEGRFALPLPTDPVPGLLLFTGKVGARAFWDSISVGWTGESRDDLEWQARH